MPLGYAGKGIALLVVSSLNAAHLPRSALTLTVLKMFCVYIPCAYLGAYLFGLNGLFFGLLLADILMGLIAYPWLLTKLKPSENPTFDPQAQTQTL